MVFSDKLFLFIFLPATFVAFQLNRRYVSGTAGVVTLILASCIFYGYWSIIFLILLFGQILVNYAFALKLQETGSKWLFRIAIALNLLLLGYFKYRNFFLENVGVVTGLHFILQALVVPLAISFHTFQQIALLADVKDDEAHLPPLLNYIFFVLFFPQLIAGPVVLHREMGPQVVRSRETRGFETEAFCIGLFLFVFGLFKKVCLADMLAPHIDLAYYPGLKLSFLEAWLASIGYPLQLYMDFSGYSDMAVGLGLMFGFRLPNNFLIPYRATSMIELWKRWHITMTRFFTMYVYLPLALNLSRYSKRRRLDRFGKPLTLLITVAAPTMITFLASGLWHGAGWTFVMFGLVNGIGLVVNHYWTEFKLVKIPMLFGWALTIGTYMIAEIYFRATSVNQANYVIGQLADFRSANLIPAWVAPLARRLGLHLQASSAQVGGYFEWLHDPTEALPTVAWIAILGVLALVLPALSAAPEKIQPSWRNAFALAGMAVLSVGVLDQPRSFLYFAF